MNRNLYKAFAILASSGAIYQAANAQASYDPTCTVTITTPYSTDLNEYFLPVNDSDNALFGVTLGISGTVQYNKACIGPNGATMNVRGRLGFTIGSLGSVQSTADDYLRLTYGMPLHALGGCGYAMTVEQAVTGGALTKTLIGANAFTTAYVGASDRYCSGTTQNGDIQIRLVVGLTGDAARISWNLTNTSANAIKAGLWFGQWVTMLNSSGIQSGAEFVTTGISKPLITDVRYIRNDNPAIFPSTVNFGVTQINAYGLQINNAAGLDAAGVQNDQSQVDELAVAQDGLLLGDFTKDGTFPDQELPDTRFADYTDVGQTGFPDNFYDETAYIQKWYPTAVPAGVSREIVSYYKSTWSVASYSKPFAVVLDAPTLLATAQNDPNSFEKDPFTLRVYVDNASGYSTIDKEIALDSVRITVSLPQGMSDAADATRSTMSKIISRIEPRKMGFVDFFVHTDSTLNGPQTYTVKVDAATGASKTLSGVINVATQPKLRINADANLVTSPWKFANNSWETILGLKFDQDFQAFEWDPQQGQYVIQTAPRRGYGTWIVSKDAQNFIDLGGSPVEPPDLKTGAPVITLHGGWNMIGNPYNYSFPLGQLVGVSAANPSQSYTFQEMVDQGFISNSVAYWDQDAVTPDYKYLTQLSDRVTPNKGYWLYVNTTQDLTLSFPPVLEPFLPARSAATFVQSDKQWRLQLVARTNVSADSQTYVGVAKSAKDAKTFRIYKPPVAPTKGAVSIAVQQSIDGKPTRLAQSLSEKAGQQEWTLQVYSKDAGPVTVTWPNLSSIPKNYRVRMVDNATGTARDLRKSSGYTFTSVERATRTITLQAVPGTPARAVIGNVIVTRPSRSPGSSFTISYALASDATTTVRVLQGGQEIYAAVRGRADQAGQRTATWNLRDSANRSVAPGVYQIEIVAESVDGERVRRVVPVTVTR